MLGTERYVMSVCYFLKLYGEVTGQQVHTEVSMVLLLLCCVLYVVQNDIFNSFTSISFFIYRIVYYIYSIYFCHHFVILFFNGTTPPFGP